MIPELMQRIREDKRIQRALLLSILLFVIFVVAIVLWPRDRFEEHKLVKTGLKADQNFGYLSGSNLYTFNGLAFYKMDLATNNALSTLYSGTKLPVPEAIYWANDQGALLNFKTSFIESKVQDELVARGLRLNQTTQNYTWYLDFATDSLHLVNEQSVQTHMATFSGKDKGFYYLPGQTGDPAALHFYNIGTKQNEVVSDDLNSVDVTYIGDCAKQRICFIARDPANLKNQRLFAIDESNQKKQLLDSNGRLFPTNDPNLFISVESKDESTSGLSRQEQFEEEDVLYEPAPARLHNLEQSSVQELGFEVGNTDITTHIKSSGDFFALDNSLAEEPATKDEVYNYRAGKPKGTFGQPRSVLFPLIYFDGTRLSDGILSASHGTAGTALLTTIAGDQLLFTTEEGPELLQLNQKTAQAATNECVRSFAQESQYFDEGRLFKIFFTQNDSFNSNVQAFSDCLLKSDISKIAGYNYYFGGVAPGTGRITTD